MFLFMSAPVCLSFFTCGEFLSREFSRLFVVAAVVFVVVGSLCGL